MRSLQTIACAGLGIALVLSSCTVEKRVHMSGYHIEWHKGKSKSTQVVQKDVAEPTAVEVMNEPVAVAQEQVIEMATPVTAAQEEVTATASTEVRMELEAGAPSAMEQIKKDQERTSAYSTATAEGAFNQTSATSKRSALKASSKAESFKEISPKRRGGGSKWLWIWIGALIAAMVFFIMAVALLSPALWIVGAVFSIAATVFFIIWLVEILS